MISNMQLTSDGTGTMGLGDQSFAVSVESVRQAEDQTAGFVANFATSWRTRTAAQIPATSTVGRSTPLSCYECRGFCVRSVQGKEVVYERTLAYLTTLTQSHRRSHLVRGKNQGPNASIACPLLVSCDVKLVSIQILLTISCFSFGFHTCTHCPEAPSKVNIIFVIMWFILENNIPTH